MTSTQIPPICSSRAWFLARRVIGLALVAILIAADCVAYVQAKSNAVTPEVREDCWIIATKWPLPPAPGQIVLLQEREMTKLCRVVKVDAAKGELVVARNGEPDRTVKLGSVQGTVVLTMEWSSQP